MAALTKEELDHFSRLLAARRQHLLEEIRAALARSGNESYAELVAGVGDTGDAANADLLSDITNAEVHRDVAEVRDIDAAQGRIAAGTYGVCIECGRPIGKERLQAYPTAKRCLEDQRHREKTRASPPHARL